MAVQGFRRLFSHPPPLLPFSSGPTFAARSFASRRAAAINNNDNRNSNGDNETDGQFAAAREWLATFHNNAIPRHIGEISFSRSGGPGGQNVNKSVPPSPLSYLNYSTLRRPERVIAKVAGTG